jgi:hypothetical protein
MFPPTPGESYYTRTAQPYKLSGGGGVTPLHLLPVSDGATLAKLEGDLFILNVVDGHRLIRIEL